MEFSNRTLVIIAVVLSSLGIESTLKHAENRHLIAEKISQFLFEQISCLCLTGSHFQLWSKQTGKVISSVYFFLSSYKLTKVTFTYFLHFVTSFKNISLSRIRRTIQSFLFFFLSERKNIGSPSKCLRDCFRFSLGERSTMVH